MLDPTKDDSNKMLILDIKSEDIPSFIKYQVATKGFVFLQKNKEDVGEYKVTDIQKLEEERKKAEEKKLFDELLKQANEPASLPPIENIKNNEPITNLHTIGLNDKKKTKEEHKKKKNKRPPPPPRGLHTFATNSQPAPRKTAMPKRAIRSPRTNQNCCSKRA